LARVDTRLIQLTWQEQQAFVYDLNTFEPVKSFTYEGEGWGLCFDGTHLLMSNGSPTISLRDPETFELVSQLQVTFRGVPLPMLNELECTGDHLYANVWQSDFIVKIEKVTGRVVAVVDASGLLSPAEAAEADVLNGIAYNPENDTFLITGKLWPKLFEVRFVEGE
jgi:glutaminyl-peptide cyclotransferase